MQVTSTVLHRPVFHLWLWANRNKVILLKSFGVTAGVFVLFWPRIKKMCVCVCRASSVVWGWGWTTASCKFGLQVFSHLRSQLGDDTYHLHSPWMNGETKRWLKCSVYCITFIPSLLLQPAPHPQPLRIMVLKMRAHHMCWRDGRGTGLSRARLKAQLLYKLLCVRSLDDTPSCS